VGRMFHSIPKEMLDRMRALEELDARDREAGAPRMKRLRQIPEVTGRFLALAAASAPAGDLVEIGTSAGYSAMWIALCGRPLTTYELLEEKASLARETFRLAGIAGRVELVVGDARERLARHDSIAFCFLDADKDVYRDCWELLIPRLVPGGVLVADNVISHAADLQPFVDEALEDVRVDALVLTIGKGLLLARRA